MRIRIWVIAAVVTGSLLSGCNGIPYNPATSSDTTAPVIGIQITGDDPSSTWETQDSGGVTVTATPVRLATVDVGARVLGTTNPTVLVDEYGEASVVATAQDNESGISSLKLSCQRTVYYNWDPDSQTEANTLLAPEVREQINQVSNGRVPVSAVQQQVLNMRGQMVFQNAAGNPIRGHRVTITCSAEARNFNGVSIQSQGVVIWAQDHAIQP